MSQVCGNFFSYRYAGTLAALVLVAMRVLKVLRVSED